MNDPFSDFGERLSYCETNVGDINRFKADKLLI